MSAADTPTRNLWAPWMAWADYGASLGDAALAAAAPAAPQVPPTTAGAPQSFPFAMMGIDKMQAMGEGVLGMFSPLFANSGALAHKLAESFWQEWMRNLRLMQDFSPLAFSGPPSTWAQWPVEAATTAMSEAMQQGNYLAASTQDAADSAAEVTRASARVARRSTHAAREGTRSAARKATHPAGHKDAHPATHKGAPPAARKGTHAAGRKGTAARKSTHAARKPRAAKRAR